MICFELIYDFSGSFGCGTKYTYLSGIHVTFYTDTQKSVSYVNFAYLSKEFTAKIIEFSNIIFMFFKKIPMFQFILSV